MWPRLNRAPRVNDVVLLSEHGDLRGRVIAVEGDRVTVGCPGGSVRTESSAVIVLDAHSPPEPAAGPGRGLEALGLRVGEAVVYRGVADGHWQFPRPAEVGTIIDVDPDGAEVSVRWPTGAMAVPRRHVERLDPDR